MTYGGAALAPHCGPILQQHGIVCACTYGQTELAGPVMFGEPGGDPNALRPLPRVRFELSRAHDDPAGTGELVLLGNASACARYLSLPSDTRQHRSLTGRHTNTSTSERTRTKTRRRRTREQNNNEKGKRKRERQRDR